MKLTFPFDPIVRAAKTEDLVMHEGTRLYYRFRASQFYGGIATADAVGCSFLCAYCWNYDRHLHPDQYRTFYSPREVASRLFISLNTVKAHTGHIYGKLNVHSRTQAVVRSQELGLLPLK